MMELLSDDEYLRLCSEGHLGVSADCTVVWFCHVEPLYRYVCPIMQLLCVECRVLVE